MPNPKTAKRPDADRPLAAAARRTEPMLFGKNLVGILRKTRYGLATHEISINKRDLEEEASYRAKTGRELPGWHSKILYSVPTDSKGNIPQDVAVARLLDIEKGDRGGRNRNAFVDLAVLSDTLVPEKPTTDAERLQQYAWYLHPNESDIAKVDTPNAKWVDRSGSQPIAMVIKGTKADRAAVIQIINDNFTNSEKKAMRGLTIDVKANAGHNAAGWYRMATGKSSTHDLITIGRNYLFTTPDKEGPNAGKEIDDVTLTHEMVHFLRARDKNRKDPITQRPGDHLTMGDRDLEESFTDSEALVRHTKAPTTIKAGYHQFLKPGQNPGEAAGDDAPKTDRQYVVYDKALMMGDTRTVNGKLVPRVPARALEEEIYQELLRGKQLQPGDAWSQQKGFRSEKDRNKATRKMFKHKKGVRAYSSVAKAYPSLTLSKLKHDGPVEAIDTYWQYKAQVDNKPVTFVTQIYSPKANISKNTAIDIAVPDRPAKDPQLSEWRDGKRVKVRIPRDEKPPLPRKR